MEKIPLILSKHASRAPGFLVHLVPYALIYDITIVEDRTSIREAIRRHAEQSDFLVVAGGDGTISAAARILAHTKKTLAVLPLGTTNNFARSLGYTTQTLESMLDFYQIAEQSGKSSEIELVDIGVAGPESFLNVASLGLSGRIAQEVDHKQKKVWGRLAYFFQAVRVLGRAKPFDVEYACKTEVSTVQNKTLVYQVLIFNGTHHAGIKIRKSSYLQSGKMYVAFLTGSNVLMYLWNFVTFMAGYPRASMERFSVPEITLTLKQKQPLELDGEPKDFQTGTFRVKHEALKVVKIPEVLN